MEEGDGREGGREKREMRDVLGDVVGGGVILRNEKEGSRERRFSTNLERDDDASTRRKDNSPLDRNRSSPLLLAGRLERNQFSGNEGGTKGARVSDDDDVEEKTKTRRERERGEKEKIDSPTPRATSSWRNQEVGIHSTFRS